MPNAFVKDQSGTSGNTTSLSGTCASTPVSGNLLIAFIASNRGSGAARTVSSIVQTGVTWAIITGCKVANGFLGLEVWRGVVGAGASTSYTITISGTITGGAANLMEISGVSTTIDATTVTNTGTSTSPSCGAYTTANGNDLIIAGLGYETNAAPGTNPSGYGVLTWLNSTLAISVQGNYIITGTKGSQTAAWTIGATGDIWATIIVALQVTRKTSTLTSSMSTMAGSIVKQPQIPLAASLATMAATLFHATGKVIVASMATVSATVDGVKSGSAKTQPLSAGMATMAASVTKNTNRFFAASMSTMAGTIARLTSIISFGASLMTFAGGVNKQDNKVFAASMSTFAGALVRGKTLIAASMATMSATLTKQTQMALAASMATMSAAMMRGRNLTASLPVMNATVTKTLSQTFAASMATMSATVTEIHAVIKALSASMATMSGSIFKTIGKFFNAS